MSLDIVLSKVRPGWSQTGPKSQPHQDAAATAAVAQQLKATTAAAKKAAAAAAANKSRFSERHQQQCSRFPAPAAALRAVATQSLQPALLHREQQTADVHQQLRQQLQELEQQQQQQQQQHSQGLPPKHQALAARMAAAAERQHRRQQQQQQQQQQGSAVPGRNGVWSSSTAADIRLLIQELHLPASLAQPLAAAAAKGQITRNPGILMSQLLRLLPLEQQLSELLGGQVDALATLLAAHPPLLRCDPASLQGNAAHVAALLGSPAAAAAAVRRYPQVLAVGPFRIAATLPVLQELLGFASTAAAGAVAARQPMLLLSSPDHLRARWRELQKLLPDVPEARLMQQLRRTPEMLLMRPSTLAGKLACLELIFAPPPAAVAPTAAAAAATEEAARRGQQPGMLGGASQQQQQQQQQRVLRVYKQHELSYRLQRLQALTQQAPMGGPDAESATAAVSSSSSSSSSNVVGSKATGEAVDPRLQRLVLKVPALLSLKPATLHSHVLELALLLGLQTDDPRLARIVLLQPGLLTQAPTTLANKLVLLQHLSGRDEAATIDTVLRVPAVLSLSCAALRAKWDLLARATAACPRWAEQLRSSQPASVGMLLCYSPTRLQRLQYVVALAAAQQQQQQSVAPAQGECAARAGAVCSAVSTAPTTTRSSSSSSHPRRRRSAKNKTPSSSSSAVAEEGQAEAAGSDSQQQLNLQSIPWRSWVQQSDAQFSTRFPGFKAWLAAAEGAADGPPAVP